MTANTVCIVVIAAFLLGLLIGHILTVWRDGYGGADEQ